MESLYSTSSTSSLLGVHFSGVAGLFALALARATTYHATSMALPVFCARADKGGHCSVVVSRAHFISDFISCLLRSHLCGGFDLAFHILSVSEVLYTGRWWCWAVSQQLRSIGGFTAAFFTALVVSQRLFLQRLSSQGQASRRFLHSIGGITAVVFTAAFFPASVASQRLFSPCMA